MARIISRLDKNQENDPYINIYVRSFLPNNSGANVTQNFAQGCTDFAKVYILMWHPSELLSNKVPVKFYQTRLYEMDINWLFKQ